MSRISRTAAWALGLSAWALAVGLKAQSPAPTGAVEMTRSTLSGVFTTAQAGSGQSTYESTCLGGCHSLSDHKGVSFKTQWQGHSVFDLYYVIHTEMPKDDPGSLTVDESVQLVAYLLKLNGLPAGNDALVSDENALKKIKIELPPSGGDR